MSLEQFFQAAYMGNTVNQYLTAAGILFGCILALVVAERVVLRRLERWADSTRGLLDDILVGVFRWAFFPMMAVGSVALALRGLQVHPMVDKVISLLWMACLTVFGVRLVLGLTMHFLRSKWAAKDEGADQALTAVTPILKTAIWSVGFIFFLDNTGVKIFAVVTGLGIGGIAVALAAQNVLGDLFSYFSILLDRPFVIGDFIIVGEHMGNVEKIGIKTTRIRSLSGEILVFPNSSLTSSRIRNYKAMEKRRVVLRFGVLYETPAKKLKEIPGLLKQIITETSGVDFDRGHFTGFGESSLDFEAVYHVQSGDYAVFMDRQQEINLRLRDELESRGVAFAYPTRTLYTAPAPKQPS